MVPRDGLPAAPGVEAGKAPQFIIPPVEPLTNGEPEDDETGDDPPERPVTSVRQLDDLLRERRRVVRCEIFRAGEVRRDDLLLVFRGRTSVLPFFVAVQSDPGSVIVLRQVLADVQPGLPVARIGAREVCRQMALLVAEGRVRLALTIEEIPNPIGASSGGSPSPARATPAPAHEPAPLRPAPPPWKPQSPAPAPASVVSTLPSSVDLSTQVGSLRSASDLGQPLVEICECSRASAAGSPT